MGLFDKLFGSAEAADDGVPDDDIACLDGKARAMIRGVVELSQTTVKEIMVPRTDVTFASLESASDELVEVIAESGHSRIPVYHHKPCCTGNGGIPSVFYTGTACPSAVPGLGPWDRTGNRLIFFL